MTLRARYLAAAGALMAAALSATSSQAQQTPPQFPEMTFFITSVGGPQGANFGGLEGADRHCQTLAAKAGAGGKTWRISAPRQSAARPPSTPGTASARVRG